MVYLADHVDMSPSNFRYNNIGTVHYSAIHGLESIGEQESLLLNIYAHKIYLLQPCWAVNTRPAAGQISGAKNKTLKVTQANVSHWQGPRYLECSRM